MTTIPVPPLKIVGRFIATNGTPVFANWDDVNAFIEDLLEKAEAVFGPDYSDPKYDV